VGHGLTSQPVAREAKAGYPCGSMPILLDSEYLLISTDSDAPIVRTVRLERSFPSNERYVEFHEQAVKVYDELDRRRYGHLIDLSRAPGNNDPRFEEATRHIRPMFTRDFAHVAFVTRTAAGALQIARLTRQGDSTMPVFQDEAAALSFLKAALSGKPQAFPATPPTPAHGAWVPTARRS
jgi:hypothetical protein